MGQNVIKIQGPKRVQRLGQKENWKTESARTADLALFPDDGKWFCPAGKIYSVFMEIDLKPSL